MGPKDVDGIANSVDPDQSALLGACVSENLGSFTIPFASTEHSTVR